MVTISNGLAAWAALGFSGHRVAIYGVAVSGKLDESRLYGPPAYVAVPFGEGTGHTGTLPATMTAAYPGGSVQAPLLGESVNGATTLADITDFTIEA